MGKLLTFSVLILALFLLLITYQKVAVNKIPLKPIVQNAVISPLVGKQHNSDIDHIVIITMENKQYGDVIGNANAPYINSLAQKYMVATNYYAVAHPSLPNYIAMIGGDTFGITEDCETCFVHAKNLVDQLELYNKTWKGYMESMPSVCFVGDTNLYAQRHNPFVYFDDIRNDKNRCNNVVPYSVSSSDLSTESTTPNFFWISPNLCHDTHDCPVQTGDTWLSQEVPKILSSQAFSQHHSLLFITYDEGEENDTNHVPMIVIDTTASSHKEVNTMFTHYSLLKTIEDIWHMPYLTGNVSESMSMLNFVNQ